MTDPDPEPDPALFSSDCQDANKKSQAIKKSKICKDPLFFAFFVAIEIKY
jgi:hypothetical protein